jgi:hypothetical protein
MDRDAFLAGLDPSLVGEEKRAGLLFASGLAAMFAHEMLEQKCPAQNVALLYIFADILNHIGSAG